MDVHDIPSIELFPFFMHEKHYGKLYYRGWNFSSNERAIKMEHIIFFKKKIYIYRFLSVCIKVQTFQSNFLTKIEYNFINRSFIIQN